MNEKKIILIGGGGHSKVVISQLIKLPDFEIFGIIDNYKSIGTSIGGIKVVGKDEDLKSFYKKGITYALVTVGSIKENMKRYELFNKAKKIGFKFPFVISSHSTVNESVSIDEGTVLMPGCIVNVDASIGKNCIINTAAVIEHDCRIGNHCHIAPGAHLSGSIEIGDMSLVGIGSTIIQGIKIGENVTVGAGSVIRKDIQDNMIAIGNPPKQCKKRWRDF